MVRFLTAAISDLCISGSLNALSELRPRRIDLWLQKRAQGTHRLDQSLAIAEQSLSDLLQLVSIVRWRRTRRFIHRSEFRELEARTDAIGFGVLVVVPRHAGQAERLQDSMDGSS